MNAVGLEMKTSPGSPGRLWELCVYPVSQRLDRGAQAMASKELTVASVLPIPSLSTAV